MEYQKRLQALANKATHHPIIRNSKWVLFVILLIIILPLINIDDIRNAVREIPLFVILLFAAFALLSRFIYAVRLYILMTNQQKGILIWNIFRINLLGDFINIALPTFISGDLVRIHKLRKYSERPSAVITATIIDRIIGMTSMVFLALFFLPYLSSRIFWELPISPQLFSVVGLTSFLIAFFFVWQYMKERISSKVDIMAFRPDTLVIAGLVSIAGHLTFSATYYLIFHELANISIFEIIGMVMLAQSTRAIPISIFGIGPNEGSLLFLGQLANIKYEVVLVALIFALAMRYLLALSGLGLELLSDGRDFISRIRKEDFRTEENN